MAILKKLIMICAACACTTAGVRAAIVVPAGLQPGDQYYLAFVTNDALNATSPDISVYDAFVQAQAAQNAALTGTDMGVQWRVVGSTSSVSAKDHLWFIRRMRAQS